jgi:ABC-type sugar transport system ATPase subunit
MQLGLALVTEDRKNLGIFDQWSVGNNITLCQLEELAIKNVLLPSRERSAGETSVKNIGIKTDGLHASILSLSGGNQQKCIIARWLLTQPKVLLLDEPTRGIDIGAKTELHDLMRRLADAGLAIVMTSSELPELIAVADRIIVLSEGRLTGEFNGTSATEENILGAATAFRSKIAAS